MLRGLVSHGAFVLVGLHRHLEVLGVALEEVALSRHLFLGVSLFHVLRLSLATLAMEWSFLILAILNVSMSRRTSSRSTCIEGRVGRRLAT